MEKMTMFTQPELVYSTIKNIIQKMYKKRVKNNQLQKGLKIS